MGVSPGVCSSGGHPSDGMEKRRGKTETIRSPVVLFYITSHRAKWFVSFG